MMIVTISLIILAAVLAVALIFARSSLGQLRRQLTAAQAVPKPVSVSEPTAKELEAQITAAYQAKITQATGTFGTDLEATSKRLNEQVSRLTTNVIEEELTAYQQTLEGVRQTANEAMAKIRAAVEDQRGELKASMEADVAGERARLIAQFDTKLGDIVASYIAESLGGGVDLGAQLQFITQSLEAHKAELKADLSRGV